MNDLSLTALHDTETRSVQWADRPRTTCVVLYRYKPEFFPCRRHVELYFDVIHNGVQRCMWTSLNIDVTAVH